MLFRLVSTVLLCLLPLATQARDLVVISDIAPVQALVKAVSAGVQSPHLLVPTRLSTHEFTLKPSDFRALNKADLVIWLGPKATPVLAKLMARADMAAKSVALGQAIGVTRLQLRRSGLFQGQTPRDALDPHMWLSPDNAQIWVGVIATALTKADPDNAATYQTNAAHVTQQITASANRARTLLASTPALPYVQFHEAYQYFEATFGLHALGAATAEDEENTSLGTITVLRQTLTAHAPACVFVRDDVQAIRAAPLTEDTGAHFGKLDPLGRGLDAAAYTYPALLMSVAQGYADCFARR